MKPDMERRVRRRIATRRIVRRRLGIVMGVWRPPVIMGLDGLGIWKDSLGGKAWWTPGRLRKWNLTCDCGMCKAAQPRYGSRGDVGSSKDRWEAEWFAKS